MHIALKKYMYKKDNFLHKQLCVSIPSIHYYSVHKSIKELQKKLIIYELFNIIC